MTAGNPPRIFVSAGEPSGDQHAAGVVTALRQRWPGAVIDAFGGPALRAAGAIIRYPMEAYTVIGFLEVLAKLPAHARLYYALRRAFRQGCYDLLICVDYPGFNLRLVDAAHRAGVRTLYYVAPQLWAWHPERARRLAGAADRVAAILPFEPAFFQSLGVPTDFVGHPLVDHAGSSRAEARAALGVAPQERVLAIFPGSRRQEVARLWPPFRDAALELLDRGACDRVIVAATPALEYPGAERFVLARTGGAHVLAAADAALVKSGTTTLQAALAGVPMVVAYRVHPLTGLIARRLMTVGWISLVNLVADRTVVPELVQGGVTAAALVEAVAPLLDPADAAAERQRAGLAEVRRRLGAPGAARRVAAIAEELLAA